MQHLTDDIYEALAEGLRDKIAQGGDYLANTRIEVEADGIVYELRCSGTAYRRAVRYPEGVRYEISDFLPTWWAIYTSDADGEEVDNDGEFEKIKEYIC